MHAEAACVARSGALAPGARGAAGDRWPSWPGPTRSSSASLRPCACPGDPDRAPRARPRAGSGILANREPEQRAARREAPPVDGVALATFHRAKGLEWPTVFVVGASEGFVPHAAATSAAALDEERRLLYVALTRAERRLIVTWAERRDADEPSLGARDAGAPASSTASKSQLRAGGRPQPAAVAVLRRSASAQSGAIRVPASRSRRGGQPEGRLIASGASGEVDDDRSVVGGLDALARVSVDEGADRPGGEQPRRRGSDRSACRDPCGRPRLGSPTMRRPPRQGGTAGRRLRSPPPPGLRSPHARVRSRGSSPRGRCTSQTSSSYGATLKSPRTATWPRAVKTLQEVVQAPEPAQLGRIVLRVERAAVRDVGAHDPRAAAGRADEPGSELVLVCPEAQRHVLDAHTAHDGHAVPAPLAVVDRLVAERR